MKTFKVALTRAYIVTIQAKSMEEAQKYTEFYLGHFPDLSTKQDQLDKKFTIENLELVINDASELI